MANQRDGRAEQGDWEGPSGEIGAFIADESRRTLEAYRNQPNLIAEHANHEEDTARGGYAHRQLFELVQNSADALALSGGGRMWVQLSPTHLYCADEGQAIDTDGVKALMFSHLSPKRGTAEIGRFGLGFKSVLGVTDTPEFFSRSGSFRFDRQRAMERIQNVAPNIARYPVLRLAEAFNPLPERESDPILESLMNWAVNIVRLPLRVGANYALGQQIAEFPAEFLLFVNHVSQLTLQSDIQGAIRTIGLSREGNHLTLDDGDNKSRWMVVQHMHTLSADAKSDSRSLDDADEVPIVWAAPLDRLNEPGKFWAFFPTQTTSLLSGILNAPWKTNEDRQNLLPGIYNDELIDSAASLVAEALPQLATPEDPAKHLDALPRRQEAGDSEQSELLRDQLNEYLSDTRFAPDQNGELRMLNELQCAPRTLTDGAAPEALERWAAYAGRPKEWLHHSALSRTRLAALDRVGTLWRTSVDSWLTALVPDTTTSITEDLQNSKVAIETAAVLPEGIRGNVSACIILTASGEWVSPNSDAVFFGEKGASTADCLVHAQLQSDSEVFDALKALGIQPISDQVEFRRLASRLFSGPLGRLQSNQWHNFWVIAEKLGEELGPEAVAVIIREFKQPGQNWRDRLHVKTRSGEWRTLCESLLPGSIVSSDGTSDTQATIDTIYHKGDLPLLDLLGATDAPHNWCQLSHDAMRGFLSHHRREFQDRARSRTGQTPQELYLDFDNPSTSGPLDVLEFLSEEAAVRYTWDLLSLDSTYRAWVMRHQTRNEYGELSVESPALQILRKHGRIETSDGIHHLSDGLGTPPRNHAVLLELLSHSRASDIRRAFMLQNDADLPWEAVGADDPEPLTDVWPGLRPHLSREAASVSLVRCDGFLLMDSGGTPLERDAIAKDDVVYVARRSDERDELDATVRALGLEIAPSEIDSIFRQFIDERVKAARDAVRQLPTDEERLLAAVGEDNLEARLPGSLIAILEQTNGSLTGVQIAQAAIATFHSGALHMYQDSLEHLDPPKQWAGSQRALEFVRSLGFGEEWAGERTRRRDPYVEVEGPWTLPDLHDYQRKIVANVKHLIQSNGAAGERRGMISMPTGSGKTRVAVQSLVESIREEGFKGGVLWVADRDELCEQAVEAWRQVWASEGIQGRQLRISRMWAGQPRPLPTGDMHVIVATIQTLAAKINRQPEAYEFLADFKMLVFDEAHRSVAPTFTSVMEELGLSRWRRSEGPLLIGLTATPYRGYDQAETQRLVNRYGNNRLDSGAFRSDDPEAVIRELQQMTVLAEADQGTITGGNFELSNDEAQQARDVPWLPRSAEHRIAQDAGRTNRIIDAYWNLVDPEWPTLIFATSVEHSQTIAALLTSMGVKARAVSGTTEPTVRRRIVEEFRSGEVKALVNYGVFREGFDAPKTRAIIVARPVYSPNLYFQMIGRGLRGTLNGGSDRCLILNVVDNIINFEGKLAFSELDWLWA